MASESVHSSCNENSRRKAFSQERYKKERVNTDLGSNGGVVVLFVKRGTDERLRVQPSSDVDSSNLINSKPESLVHSRRPAKQQCVSKGTLPRRHTNQTYL